MKASTDFYVKELNLEMIITSFKTEYPTKQFRKTIVKQFYIQFINTLCKFYSLDQGMQISQYVTFLQDDSTFNRLVCKI